MAQSKSHKWIYALAGAGYLWLGLNVTGLIEGGATICMFKQVTGVACPSCGLTRSLLQIVNGDLIAGLMINPLGVLAALFLMFFPFVVGYQLVAKRPIVKVAFVKFESLLRRPAISVLLVLLVVVNWYWNITKGL